MLPHIHPFWSNLIADSSIFFQLGGGIFLLGGRWTWRFCFANLVCLGLLYYNAAQKNSIDWFKLPSPSNPQWSDVGPFWYFLAYSTVLICGPGRYSNDFTKHTSPSIFKL